MNYKKYILTAMLAFSTMLLVACGGFDYDDMTHIDDFSELSTYDETGEPYLIYYYLPQCPACQDLFDDIADYYQNHQDKMPMVLSYQTTGESPAPVSHVPSIVVMQDGEVLDGPIVGVAPIQALFEDIIAETYTP